MELHHHADPIVQHPVDVPQLPKRMVTVELRAQNRRDGLRGFAWAARCRDAETADVPGEIELGVVHPHGPVEAQRRRLELPGELRDEREPLPDRTHQGVEPEVGRVAPIEHVSPATC